MPPTRTNTMLIRTPEGVTFPLHLADPVTRCLAWLIDHFCVLVLAWIIGFVASMLRWISYDLSGAVTIALYFCGSIGYPIVTEWFWRGQTIGKRIFRLRVIDEDGLRLQFSQIVIRNLLRFVDSLPSFYLVGGAATLLNSRAQRLGDIAANTIVIRHAQPIVPDLDQLLPGKFNSFRGYPHLVARLRQSVSPEEADIALRALMRRENLDPEARLKLFAQLTGHFEELAAFPPECTDGISDEQHVRNVVDVLFR
jgi:uncharacterized RDD family membrane protein YckC